jgi:hypothetical protein
MSKACKQKCDIDKICNPDTGRCVTKSGKIGKTLLAKKKSDSPKPTKKKTSPPKVSKKKSPETKVKEMLKKGKTVEKSKRSSEKKAEKKTEHDVDCMSKKVVDIKAILKDLGQTGYHKLKKEELCNLYDSIVKSKSKRKSPAKKNSPTSPVKPKSPKYVSPIKIKTPPKKKLYPGMKLKECNTTSFTVANIKQFLSENNMGTGISNLKKEDLCRRIKHMELKPISKPSPGTKKSECIQHSVSELKEQIKDFNKQIPVFGKTKDELCNMLESLPVIPKEKETGMSFDDCMKHNKKEFGPFKGTKQELCTVIGKKPDSYIYFLGAL